MSLTREELDQQICEECGREDHARGELALHARCHPKAGMRVTYHKKTGELTFACKLCKKHVTTIQVAGMMH